MADRTRLGRVRERRIASLLPHEGSFLAARPSGGCQITVPPSPRSPLPLDSAGTSCAITSKFRTSERALSAHSPRSDRAIRGNRGGNLALGPRRAHGPREPPAAMTACPGIRVPLHAHPRLQTSIYNACRRADTPWYVTSPIQDRACTLTSNSAYPGSESRCTPCATTTSPSLPPPRSPPAA